MLTRAEFDEAVAHLAEAHWTFERDPDEAWRHFRGWRVNYEAAAHGIAAHLDLPPALWSGPRARLGTVAKPQRPAHREPDASGPEASPAGATEASPVRAADARPQPDTGRPSRV